MLKRRLIISAIACLAILGVASAAVLSSPAEEIKGMNDDNGKLSETGGIPPIDAAAPAHMETATFSLG